MPGNNSDLIRKCMTNRGNWKEIPSSSLNFNMKWQQTNVGIDYTNLTRLHINPQIFNHFEFHHLISNKLNLFLNLLKYCEANNLDIFNYIPFTVIMQYDSPKFRQQFESFSDFFNNIEKFLNPKNEKKYSELFRLDIHNHKDGFKTIPFINKTHYNKKNMWLVKAVNLNRGRCIKIGDSIDEIKKIIKNFNDGVFKEIKESIEEHTENTSNKKKVLDFKKYKSSQVLVQKYIEKPLLYYGRKFDVRIWVLFDHINNVYVFKEGHLKTSSLNYNINLKDSYVHLTNYSVQKYNKEFSKYEVGNEVSFKEFKVLDKLYRICYIVNMVIRFI
jgi:tubulin--tyrosine ligase